MTRIPENVINIFNSSFKKEGDCWIWNGQMVSGAPNIRVGTEPNRFSISGRRISIILSGQTISPDEYVQPLICKNKLCVNPKHLVFGDEARFYNRVLKLSDKQGGCWVYTGAHDKNGYGQFVITENGKTITVRAHQYSWYLQIGRYPPRSLVICHRCDHPWCVNPNHLSVGEPKDNSQDMVNKDRRAKGEKNGNAKLTEQLVKDIRTDYALLKNPNTGSKYGVNTILEKKYNLPKGSVAGITSGRSWKHIKIEGAK